MTESIQGWNLQAQSGLLNVKGEKLLEWSLGVGLTHPIEDRLSLDFSLSGENVPTMNSGQRVERWFLGGGGRLRWRPFSQWTFLDGSVTAKILGGKQNAKAAAKGSVGTELGFDIPLGDQNSIRLFAGVEAGIVTQRRMSDLTFLGGLDFYRLFAKSAEQTIPIPVVTSPAPRQPPTARPQPAEPTESFTEEEIWKQELERHQQKSEEAEGLQRYEEALEEERQILKLEPTAPYDRYFYFQLMTQFQEQENISRERLYTVVQGPLLDLVAKKRYQDVALGIRLFLSESRMVLSTDPAYEAINALIVLKDVIELLYSEEVQQSKKLDRKTFFTHVKEAYFYEDSKEKKQKLYPGVLDGLRLFVEVYAHMDLDIQVSQDVFKDFKVELKKPKRKNGEGDLQN